MRSMAAPYPPRATPDWDVPLKAYLDQIEGSPEGATGRTCVLVDTLEPPASLPENLICLGSCVLPKGRLLQSVVDNGTNEADKWVIIDTASLESEVINIDLGDDWTRMFEPIYLPELGFIAAGVNNNFGAATPKIGVAVLDATTLEVLDVHEITDLAGGNTRTWANAWCPERRTFYASFHQWIAAFDIALDGTITREASRDLGANYTVTCTYSRAIDKVCIVSFHAPGRGLQRLDPVTLANSGALISSTLDEYYTTLIGSKVVSSEYTNSTPRGLAVYDLFAASRTQIRLDDKQFPPSGGLVAAAGMAFNQDRNLLYVASWTPPAGGTVFGCLWVVNLDTARVEDYLDLPAPASPHTDGNINQVHFDPVTGRTFVIMSWSNAEFDEYRVRTYVVR